MKRRPSASLHVHIQRNTKQRLQAYAAAKDQSQGSIVEAALREYLDESSQQALVLRELQSLRRGMSRLERNLDVLDAALAGYVQFWLAYNPPLPDSQKQQAQTLAAQRFEQFLTFLQQQIRTQHTFMAQLQAEDWEQQDAVRALLAMEQDQGTP